MKTWFAEVGVEELERPAQIPDLNLTEHLYDESEHRHHTRPSYRTSVPNRLRFCGWMNANPQNHAPKSSRKPSQNRTSYYNSSKVYINAYGFGMGSSILKCPHPFSYIVYIHHLLVKEHETNTMNPSYQWWYGTTNKAAKWLKWNAQHPSSPLLKP